MKSLSDLIAKYDVQAPRYTSYPTVPHWKENPTPTEWIGFLNEALAPTSALWSLYMHIPFCETLCTFCGCNTSITKNKKLGGDYVSTVLKEWDLYRARVPGLAERKLQGLHLGGGSPTFLPPADLERLLVPMLEKTRKTEHFEASLEVDPRRTTEEQLVLLRQLGFNRISLGVQDLDPNVQRLINRNQTLEQTRAITEMSRKLGYASVNWDLIYGLPQQTAESITSTIRATLEQMPDRIALYSFALVPWIKPQQRLFTDADLPMGQAKRDLYELSRKLLMDGGYEEVGMDHFALPSDALTKAQRSGHLHRNFMGYTDQRTEVMLGLGVSSISETPKCFHQNEKVLANYQKKVDAGETPTHRGHKLTAAEMTTREQILELMTTWRAKFTSPAQREASLPILEIMAADGLLEVVGDEVRVLDAGKPFLRNACMVLDPNLPNEAVITATSDAKKQFSRSI